MKPEIFGIESARDTSISFDDCNQIYLRKDLNYKKDSAEFTKGTSTKKLYYAVIRKILQNI